ncbi:MAG: porphobilinogen synthase [Candidatus Latescibacteria bacterium]|nr:porphobilinogen synthase [Candidatus Latescibacterota bacterium]
MTSPDEAASFDGERIGPVRPRRLRRTGALRGMVREHHVRREDLILPLFACPGTNVRHEIDAMPGVAQMSIDLLVEECRSAAGLGVAAVILFGIPPHKDAEGSPGYDPQGIVPRASGASKEAGLDDLLVIADVCLCEYTDHGHCGVIHESAAGAEVDNDRTVELLVRESLVYAASGADIIAPSDMMDGRVGRIRTGLDEAGHNDIPIMAYAAKYASAFYGPFREAAGSAPQFGDRRGYQMDPPNVREAMLEISLDLDEGADIIMVKPALAYLDVLRAARQRFDVPLAAYNVSGEYAMIKAAAQQGWIDEVRVRDEVLVSIKRAGADMILTYFAKDVARTL